MRKQSKIILIIAVLLLAFAQVASAALTGVGPINPTNGFPTWYRSSTGQTITLSVPPDAVSIPDNDPILDGFPVNAFAGTIGFNSEAMYWHSTAIIDPLPVAVGGGQALLVMALEAAFNTGDAAPGEQVTFARIRIRIDTTVPGPYTVTHPYGTNTFTVTAADIGTDGRRAINFTSDVGIGAPGDFTGALKGQIDPFLVQAGVAPPAGTVGDATTPTTVTGGPNGNVFRVVGPAPFGTQETALFVTGGELFAGTPFTIDRATYTKTAAGAFAEVFANVPAPAPTGVKIFARVRPEPGVRLTQSGTQFFGRFPFDGVVPNQVFVTGSNIDGTNATLQKKPLKDAVTITKAQYSVSLQQLTVAATSSDAVGPVTLTAFAPGTAAVGVALNPLGADTIIAGVLIAPLNVKVVSSQGGRTDIPITILP